MLRTWASTTLRSAEMRSPEPKRTTSSTTNSPASNSTGFPSRMTVALRGSRSRRRSAARSALYSWTKAKRPFITTTAKMATPSSGILATKARIPAPQSSSAKKWNICPARRRHAGGGGVTGRTLGPSRSRRFAASAELKPSRIPEEGAGAGTSPGFTYGPSGSQSRSSSAPLRLELHLDELYDHPRTYRSATPLADGGPSGGCASSCSRAKPPQPSTSRPCSAPPR